MAFRKKADLILTYKPDILWFGKNKNKGLAIFSYSNFRFKVLDNYNQDLQMIIPIAVTDGQIDFNLFAIWANNATDKDGQYIEQIWKAIHHYSNLLTDTKTILVSDFNSNTKWDRKHRESNHSNVVKLLEERGIFSTYHLHYKLT